MTAAEPEFDPVPGVPVTLSAGLRRILAPNPSPMTWRGTNTYLVGTRDIAVIDPGPSIDAHFDAILAALLPGQRISHVVVTHSHQDHSPLAAALSRHSGAPVLGFGGPEAGRSAVMAELAAAGMTGGGEGIDADFRPDTEVADGDVIDGDGWRLEVIHTPGHMGNHIALAWGQACFTADHVMGWASSLVSPPDGDLTDFMKSCRRLRARDWTVFHPGHGAPVTEPAARLDWLISHREGRAASILAQLEHGPAPARSLAMAIYTDTPSAMMPAATRNVFAHLIDLMVNCRVKPLDALTAEARFARVA